MKMSGPIIFENEDYFRLDFGNGYDTIIVSPPLIFNNSGEQVGVTVEDETEGRYRIHYTFGHYGVSIVTIPPHSIIFTDSSGTKSSNDLIIESITFRSVPEITFQFPNTSIPVNFSTGIRVEINLQRAPAMELPLILDNPFFVNVKTSSHLVYNESLNKIFFVPTESNTYEEWFEIIPIGNPVTILNQTYNITVGTVGPASLYTITPVIGSSYNYTTIDSFLPLAILNPEFTNTMVDNIWRRNTLYVLCETTPKDIYTFNVRSADDNPVFELMNHNTIFEISSSGVLRSKGFPFIGMQIYDLTINITNGLNEIIDACFRVTCYDIFSEFYFQSFMEDIMKFRQLSIIVEACENSISIYNKEVRKLGDAVFMLLQGFSFMMRETVSVEFKTIPEDVQTLGNILVYGNGQEFLDFLLSKFPVMSTTSLLYMKLTSISTDFFPYFKNFLKAFTVNPDRGNTYKLETPFGNMVIKKW